MHESRYTFDLTSYIKKFEKVRINCPEHCWFNQNASLDLDQKLRCPYCGRESQSHKRQLNIEAFFERS